MRRPALILLTVLAAVAACSSDKAQSSVALHELPLSTEARWAELFDDYGVEGTVVVHKLGEDKLQVHNPERAELRMIPASTFKILNSLIALETGAISGVDEVIPWDGVDRSVDAWNQDHTLRSGIAVSAVWAYQDLARRIGEEQMAEWVRTAAYGNTDIGGPIRSGGWLDTTNMAVPIGSLPSISTWDRRLNSMIKSILRADSGWLRPSSPKRARCRSKPVSGDRCDGQYGWGFSEPIVMAIRRSVHCAAAEMLPFSLLSNMS